MARGNKVLLDKLNRDLKANYKIKIWEFNLGFRR